MERQLGADSLAAAAGCFGSGGGINGAGGINGGGGGGGGGGTDSPAQQMQRHYEGKLAELERERETIEQEKEQVHRYKALLQKQRDIMIALTARLNERDEALLSMQVRVRVRVRVSMQEEPHAPSAPSLALPPARHLRLLRARLAAPGSSALPGRGRPTGRPATASGARASRLQSRRFHRLWPSRRSRTARTGARASSRTLWTARPRNSSTCSAWPSSASHP